MTRVVFIKAGPTPWDLEDRISGNHTLPLTDDARAQIVVLLESVPPVDAIYRAKKNEACDQVAKLVATLHNLRPRDDENLDAWGLGLWQGLRMEDIRQRYRAALEQWEQSPATIVPPEGEAFTDAVDRLHRAMRKIVRRNRNKTIAVAARQSAMQILIGILRRETPEQIAGHLQNDAAIETIELSEQDIKEI
jgi:probable phosphoglycerate mutase